MMGLRSVLIITVFFILFDNVRADEVSFDTLNYYVFENAEDGTVSKAFSGTHILCVYDSLKEEKVVYLIGSATLFKNVSWDPENTYYPWNVVLKGISWEVRSNEDFEVELKVNTSEGVRYLHYYVADGDKTDNSPHLYYKLDRRYKDGTWYKIFRDLNTDISLKESGNSADTLYWIKFITESSLAIDNVRGYYAEGGAGDLMPPEIHLNGEINMELEAGKIYVEPGAYAVDNVTPANSIEINIDASGLDVNTPGMYRIKYTASDAAGNVAKTVYRVVNVRSSENIIGAREVYPTPLELGTFFVSQDGSGLGDGSDVNNAVSWEDFLTEKWKVLKPGDVVFFRGGEYYFTEDLPGITFPGGKKDLPVIYESYPGELAVFDGSLVDTLDIHRHSGNVTLFGNSIWVRKMEFRNLPHWGPRIWGANCIMEGVSSHHNRLSGIEISSGYNTFHNIVRDNYLFENSDTDIKGGGDVYDEYNYGNNADGLTLHSGVMNIITHNTVYENSDDGVDSWDAQLTVFSYNYVRHEGKATYKGRGDGGGIKLGGPGAYGTQVFHNIMEEINFRYGDYVCAIKNNATTGAVMAYNTMHKSKYSIDYVATSRIYRNIVLRASHGIMNAEGDPMPPPADTIENSFNMIPAWLYPKYDEVVSLDEYCTDAENRMLSIDPASPDYLHPDPHDLFANIGAYAEDDSLPDIIPPTVFPYGPVEVNIPKGALYIEPGAFAYDSKDGFLKVKVSGWVDPENEAVYVIGYYATDAAGNTATFERRVTVGAGGPVLGAEDVQPLRTSFLLYPNPSSGIVHIDLPDGNNEYFVFSIFNLSGKVVETHTFGGTHGIRQARLDLSKLPDGIYIISGTNGNNRFVRKLVIRK